MTAAILQASNRAQGAAHAKCPGSAQPLHQREDGRKPSQAAAAASPDEPGASSTGTIDCHEQTFGDGSLAYASEGEAACEEMGKLLPGNDELASAAGLGSASSQIMHSSRLEVLQSLYRYVAWPNPIPVATYRYEAHCLSI